nr:11818_t:CDS:2 [Entrophospora candida]
MKFFVIPLFKNQLTYYCLSNFDKPPTYLSKASDLAARKWKELSYAEKKSIKGRVYNAGQKLLDRMDYQEYFLKSIPIREERVVDGDVNKDDKSKVPLLYPSKVVTPNQIILNIEQLLERKIPYHRRYMIYSGLCLPLSATFTLVPILPNIPLFYNLFRLYSHYKAYKGATHLQHIINDKRLVPTDSNKLNLIYKDLDLDKSIIDEDTIRRISKALGISVLEVDMKRARHQILERLQKDNKL